MKRASVLLLLQDVYKRQPDERKAGGAYVTATGEVIKVDDFERLITMQDGKKIPMDDILSIDGRCVYETDFWGHSGKDHAGTEIRWNNQFDWARHHWVIPFLLYTSDEG